MTTELEQKIAEQAAVIEQRIMALIALDALLRSLENSGNFYGFCVMEQDQEALAIPTDSKQVLQEYLDKVLGEPELHAYKNTGQYAVINADTSDSRVTALFKKPEIK